MTTPLKTCACPAPAKFRQLLCMRTAPQPMAKAQEFLQMLAALFIIVSCKLALTELEKRTLKVLMLRVLFPSYKCHSTDTNLITGHFPAACMEISTSLYIPLHHSHFCQICTTLHEGCFLLPGTVIKH